VASKVNIALGLAIIIVLGHLAFILAIGLGALLAFVWVNMPTWAIVGGSLLCSSVLIFDLVSKDTKNEK
jgi:hypothetical protein